MNRYVIILIVFLQTIMVYAQENRFSETIQKTLPAIFIVKTFDKAGNSLGLGTGFFIDSKGTGITNFHVLQGAQSAKIYLEDKREFEISFINGLDKKHDIIQFVINNNSNTTFKYLTYSTLQPKLGEDVFTIGNPEGLSFTASNGIVSSIREDDELGQIIQTTTPISHGSSGSPLLNIKGEIIGIMSFYLKEGQNLNFAYNSSYIKNLTPIKPTFVFPEGGKTNEIVVEKDMILKKYEWNTTQYSVKKTETALLISDKPVGPFPELRYLCDLFGKPCQLSYQFEGGLLSQISYSAVFGEDYDEFNTTVNDAVNIFQVTYGELKTLFGEETGCWKGCEPRNNEDDNPSYCLHPNIVTSYYLQSIAKDCFTNYDNKRDKTESHFLDMYRYNTVWHINSSEYTLSIIIFREDYSFFSNRPNELASCHLSISPIK